MWCCCCCLSYERRERGGCVVVVLFELREKSDDQREVGGAMNCEREGYYKGWLGFVSEMGHELWGCKGNGP